MHLADHCQVMDEEGLGFKTMLDIQNTPLQDYSYFYAAIIYTYINFIYIYVCVYVHKYALKFF